MCPDKADIEEESRRGDSHAKMETEQRHAAPGSGGCRMAQSQQKLEKARRGPPLSPEPLEGVGPCAHPDFRLRASRTVRE